MRVLMVSSHGADRSRGGTERYVADLTSCLEARGHEIELVSAFPVRDASASRTRVLRSTDWVDNPIRRKRNHIDDWAAIAWPRFDEILLAARPDVVHTNSLPGFSTGIWERARRLRIPVVHTLHDYYLLCPRTTLTRRDLVPCTPHPYLCGLRTRRLARWASGVRVAVGVSSYVLSRHDALFPASVTSRVIAPPIVPIKGIGADRRRPASLACIGYLGSLAPTKGVELLLQAAPALAERGVAVRIAGDGPLRHAVESCSHVSYHGHLTGDALTQFIASCDAGIVPSLWEEPAGYVALEWLAAGRPLLSTGRAGLLDAAAKGGTFEFDGTVSGVVDTVERLRDADAWQRALASLPRVDDTSDLDRWIESHEEAYRVASGA